MFVTRILFMRLIHRRCCLRRRLAQSEKIKATPKDIQPMCSQQLLFSKFVSCYLNKYGFNEYERRLRDYYDVKLDYVRGELKSA